MKILGTPFNFTDWLRHCDLAVETNSAVDWFE